LEINGTNKVLQKWIQIYSVNEADFSALPVWAQDILLEDIKTALQNRIVVIQRAST
jgi:hypothetical protein